MRVVVTGGGTGGHVFPALEVAGELRSRGIEIAYHGSNRGMEGAAASAAGYPFVGYDAHPLVSMRSPTGWRALARLARASLVARQTLARMQPDAVFSTGGYSAAPVLWAARALGVPFVLHEANSVPGRVTRMFAPRAWSVTAVFRETESRLPGAIRTGQPVRAALRAIVPTRGKPTLLVMGGSGGAGFLNEGVPAMMAGLPEWRVVHASGRGRLAEIKPPHGRYEAVEFLSGDALLEAFASATVFVGRSGGTLAELAALRLPSVLIPLPNSADDHQAVNAREFAAMGAADILTQAEFAPDRLRAALEGWTEPRREEAARMLGEWDRPDATMRIADLVVASPR